MTDPVLKLQILARTEMTLARIHARRATRRGAYFAFALVLALLGLGMLTFACYLALLVYYSPAVAASLVAAADLLLAAFIILAANRGGQNTEEERMAREIRELAYAEVSADIDAAKEELARVGSDVRRIKSGFTSFTDSASSGLNTLLPILNMLIKAVKRD